MNNANAIEVSMPVVQPADLWQESGRWEQYGPELLRFVDRGDRPFVLGPTHEEVITDLIRNEISSYKQLPLNFFQIQTKFRDEVRPRFGVMRSREFLMKDSYPSIPHRSLCRRLTTRCTKRTAKSSAAWAWISARCRPIPARSAAAPRTNSRCWQTAVKTISCSPPVPISPPTSSWRKRSRRQSRAPRPAKRCAWWIRRTPKPSLNWSSSSGCRWKTVKTLMVRATEESGHKLVALLVRGDHELNEVKAEKLAQVAAPLTFATEEEIRAIVGAGPGSLGPVNLPMPVVADRSVAAMSDFGAGANVDGKHYFGINWERDLPLPQVADIRNVVEGDASPDGQGTLLIKRGIEVGHIFQLGTKYSEAMKATVQGEDGRNQVLTMGCYGIGVTRVVAAAIEQNHDERGIIWPDAIAPFQVAILPMNMHKSFRVQALAEELYNTLRSHGIDVILDDRKERPGVMFADMELIGVPHSIVIGDRNLDNEEIEYKNRRVGEKQMIKTGEIVDFLLGQIKR